MTVYTTEQLRAHGDRASLPLPATASAGDGFGCRREFFYQLGTGLGSVALSWLLHRDGLRAADGTTTAPAQTGAPHFPARARSCIFLLMEGGPSHIDTFDPKPRLERADGKVFKRKARRSSFAAAAGAVSRSASSSTR